MTEEISNLVEQVKDTKIYQNRLNYRDYRDMGVSESEIEDFISLVNRLSGRYFWCILREDRGLAMGHYSAMTHELAVELSVLRHRQAWVSSINTSLDCLMSLIETGKMTAYYSRCILVNPS